MHTVIMARGGYRGVAYGRARGWKPQFPRRRRPPPQQPRMPVSATPRMGTKVRKGGSTTATTTKTKLYSRAYKVGDNASRSVTIFGRKWGRLPGYLYRRIQGRQTDIVMGSSSVSCTQGRQNVLSTVALNRADLNRLKVKANDGVATEQDIKMFFGVTRLTTVFRNQSNTVAHVTMYDILCKRLPATTAIDTPVEAWQKGYTDHGAAVSGELTLGNSPLRSPEFNQHFKIVRVVNHALEAGEEHSHNFAYHVNRVVRSTVFDHTGSVTAPWLTMYTLVVFHGSLGHESLDTTKVGTMPITLDYMYRCETSFGWIQENAAGLAIADYIPTTVADFDFMGESGDADMNANTA